MIQAQVLAVIRAVLPAILMYAVGKGWISTNAVADITGAIVTLLSAVWAIGAHSQTAMVAAVGKLAESPNSPVKAVILERTAEGSALANVIDNPSVMSAGSASAAAVAR